MNRIKNFSLNYPEYLVDMELMTDKIIQTCTGDQRLDIMNAVQQICLSVSIQFRKDIVKKKDWRVLYFFLYKIYFRQFKRKSRRPLLSLGSVSAYVHAVHHKTQIVSVRARRRHFQPDILIPVPLKYLFKRLRLCAGFIDYFRYLLPSRQIPVNLTYYRIQLLYEFSSFFRLFFYRISEAGRPTHPAYPSVPD